jgi:hypothetical protein
METQLYHHIIDDIRAYTKDETYHIHIVGDRYCLRRCKAKLLHDVSPDLYASEIEIWLSAFIEGIHTGYITAKRSA